MGHMGGVLLRQNQVCDFNEPATCAVVFNDPAETFLEKRDDEYIAKVKADTTLTDLRPEHAYEYEACSSKTGTALMHMGTPVANEWCQALGCNYKQCVQKKHECDREKGVPMHDEPMIQCVAAATQSDIQPAHFVAFLFALLGSLSMCITGCFAPVQSSADCVGRVQEVNIVQSTKQINVVPALQQRAYSGECE